MTITYVSVCDGIGAVHVAWRPMGWRCAWTSEIEPYPAAVVDHHWGLPNLGDMTKIDGKEALREYGTVDLVCGGTPCQSFSVAGLRKGLADPRGNLALVYLRLVDSIRPRWVVWENVPGVLSSGRGRDFGAFLGALGQLGYGWTYRVLDAQFFGVAQRRRRVFVVGYLGDWRRAAAVLLDSESLRGNPAPRRQAGARVARSLTSSTGGCSGKEQQHTFIGASGEPLNGLPDVSPAMKARDYKGPSSDGTGDGLPLIPVAHTLRSAGYNASEDGTGRGTPLVPCYGLNWQAGGNGGGGHFAQQAAALIKSQIPGVAVAFQARIARNGRGQPEEVCPALSGAGAGATSDMRPCVAVPLQEVGKRESLETGRAGLGVGQDGEPMYTLQAGAQHGVAHGYAVRRLTPRECERLQGFPDNYTLIDYRGKPAADGPRYQALGNSMAVPVMAWIGRRIMEAQNAH